MRYTNNQTGTKHRSGHGIGMKAYGTLIELAKRLQNAGILSHPPMVEVAELIWMTLHGIVSLQITCVGLKLAPAENLVKLATQTLAGQQGLLREKAISGPARAVVRRTSQRRGALPLPLSVEASALSEQDWRQPIGDPEVE